MAKIRNYYAAGNTAKGFYSLFDYSLQGLDRLYILKGGPGTGKSTLMKKVGKLFSSRGYDIEYIHCASDNASIDGVMIPHLNAGIVDGTAPHVIEPKTPGAVEQYVNLGEAWDVAMLSRSRNEIEAWNERIHSSYSHAYAKFAEALRIHDEWEQIYIAQMDFERANRLTERLLDDVLGDRCIDKKATVRRRFLGAATPRGAADFIPNLTEDVNKRIFLKGRPGTGKSTMLKKLASEAELRGWDVEIYHCGFDPQSLDMVILRELDVAVFDSTPPHEYFPERVGDIIIDLYEQTIAPGTDEAYDSQLKDIQSRYAMIMKQAIAGLALAKRQRDRLEAIYRPAMNFDMIGDMREHIEAELLRMVAGTR